MSENSKAHKNYGTYHTPAIQSIGTRQSVIENLDMFKQTITVYGDMEINAGKKLTVTAPKAIDPQVYKKVKKSDAKKQNALDDMMVSGDYLIATVRHVFDTEYTCEILLKRDYSNYTLDAAE